MCFDLIKQLMVLEEQIDVISNHVQNFEIDFKQPISKTTTERLNTLNNTVDNWLDELIADRMIAFLKEHKVMTARDVSELFRFNFLFSVKSILQKYVDNGTLVCIKRGTFNKLNGKINNVYTYCLASMYNENTEEPHK